MYRSFVVRIQPYETIARVRAQLLHILYEIMREDHQFRLRYKGQYLRDSYTVEDYGIIDNSVVKMVPLSKKQESTADLRSLTDSDLSEQNQTSGIGMMPDVKEALLTEIKLFNTREKLIYHFKGLLYVHFLLVWFCFLTTFWYSGFWTGAIWIFATLYCPTFTRFSGFIGRQSIYKTEFCLIYGSLALCQMTVCVFFAVYEWTLIVDDGCKDFVFDDNCSHRHVFSAVLYTVQAMCLLVSACLTWALLWNIKVEYGDFVEKYLVQNRDIDDVLKAARSGRVKDRRVAAFELATMAASGDDNKFRIVAEGGLELLIRMALSRDTATQEHAVEAIAELMTVPAIQDNFVEMGGVKTLTALLHSKDHKLVYQAATAVSYITADSEENKAAVATDHGLEDLCRGARIGNISCQKLIAGIFLDLAFNSEIRLQMSCMNSPAQALIHLARSHDPDTQRFALQSLELLAIESADMICAQSELLQLLLQIPDLTVDTKVYILAGKILLYYAENQYTCEQMMDQTNCKESLFQYARTQDPILQKVVVKVIYSMLEVRELKARAKFLEMDEILRYIQDHAADREVWDMADQALQFMASDDDLRGLPAMTAAEKLERFTPEMKRARAKKFGSRVSLTSTISADSIKKPPIVD